MLDDPFLSEPGAALLGTKSPVHILRVQSPPTQKQVFWKVSSSPSSNPWTLRVGTHRQAHSGPGEDHSLTSLGHRSEGIALHSSFWGRIEQEAQTTEGCEGGQDKKKRVDGEGKERKTKQF